MRNTEKLARQLFKAVVDDKIKNVKFLLRLGANIHSIDDEEYEPIMYVKSKEMLEVLLANGADVNFCSPLGDNLLMMVVDEQNLELVREILKNDVNLKVKNFLGDDVLYKAVMWGNNEILKLLIEKGADVNTVYRDKQTKREGDSILTVAVMRKNLEAVKLLVENGADVKYKVYGGWSPLMCAVEVQNYDIARYLIEKGAEVNDVDNVGQSVLMHAVGVSDKAKEIVGLLLANGADVEVKDIYGKDFYSVSKSLGAKGLIDYVKKYKKSANLLNERRNSEKNNFLSKMFDKLREM